MAIASRSVYPEVSDLPPFADPVDVELLLVAAAGPEPIRSWAQAPAASVRIVTRPEELVATGMIFPAPDVLAEILMVQEWHDTEVQQHDDLRRALAGRPFDREIGETDRQLSRRILRAHRLGQRV